MPDDGTRRPVTGRFAELLLLQRIPRVGRVLLAVALLCVCASVAQLSLTAQHHFASLLTSDRWSLVLARGSSAATAWPGWVAAVFFAVALLRLRRSAPEPPAGRTPVESLSLTQMRRGLVREYTLARAAVVLVLLLALLDAGRAARYTVATIGGDTLARGSLPATLIEAAGLVAAAVVLILWTLSFRAQLERVGAIR